MSVLLVHLARVTSDPFLLSLCFSTEVECLVCIQARVRCLWGNLQSVYTVVLPSVSLQSGILRSPEFLRLHIEPRGERPPAGWLIMLELMFPI